MERLFCPTCGNAALQKVEMVIGENGAEQYGARKKHIIRGTRYSLPKPKASFICPLLLRDFILNGNGPLQPDSCPVYHREARMGRT